ncbi:MAG: amidohydrolase family protein [Armatimonadota bacterium]|jgi:predicted TIM-barrel fold metal-dependent hydrolase
MGIIDVHGHFGRWPFPIGGDTVGNLLELTDRFGIETAVVSSSKAIVYDMAEGNAELAEVLQRTDGLLGYVTTNPNHLGASCRQMDRYLPRRKFVGVKVHPTYSRCAVGTPAMGDLISEIARRQAILKIHTFSAAAAMAMAAEAARHPEMPIILAHAGGAEARETATVAREHPNVYLEFCCGHAERGKVRAAILTAGLERILFGSDLDLINPAFVLGMYEGAELTDAEKQAIYHDNAARLFGLS